MIDYVGLLVLFVCSSISCCLRCLDVWLLLWLLVKFVLCCFGACDFCLLLMVAVRLVVWVCMLLVCLVGCYTCSSFAFRVVVYMLLC